jgi:hypothetical protein
MVRFCTNWIIRFCTNWLSTTFPYRTTTTTTHNQTNKLQFTQAMECTVCFDCMDDDMRKPTIFGPCGHTFCLACCRRLHSCATCTSECRGLVTNWIVLHMGSPQPDAPSRKRRRREVLANAGEEFARKVQGLVYSPPVGFVISCIA